ncbi:glycerophosphoryl diester phosphodiesterase membrane domain-containing protein [Microbacterium sp. PRF11]|uniref:glycerophosphoryl diester phosphodiesterase membrane domain-containing protein n=1 Tax=Microbacterium sp. PRF11 TaxID=2962593 RepID=UPI0028827649|nr:glycerophosphoryl diester phosphodiesterase membrane domain-containing protein [Microbacterium sp. PRF11]MDT0115734.1 glycerophosphoryl diester phosphodiesterase membrane domain-containing protein [Microbacterium sp. PRF11]
MTAYPAWTPAARPGIVPLHPYGFGTILGRSFTALRHNPKVLLGFALVVQAVASVVVTAAISAVGVASFARLDTVTAGSDDYDAIMAGSIALTAATALVLGALTGALTVIVQGVVVAEVAHAVVAEKPSLEAVWGRVRPAVWRLIGYGALTLAAVSIVIGILAGIVVLLVIAATWVGAVVGVLAFLALIPLYLWLSTKLFLVPSVIILERSPVFAAIARSWRLTRGRFWPTLGVIVIISFGFSVVAQIISIPFSLISSVVTGILAPTGGSDPSTIAVIVAVQVAGQAGVLLIQCIALVVQSTSAVLVYVDARMRVEALDHDLQTYVEARDAGATDLADPYLIGVGRVVARPTAVAPGGHAPPRGYVPYGAPPVYGQAPGVAAPPAPANAMPPSTPPAPPAPPAPAEPSAAPAAPEAAPADAPPAASPDSPAATRWAAPGSNGGA